jgi:hypothetical protein
MKSVAARPPGIGQSKILENWLPRKDLSASRKKSKTRQKKTNLGLPDRIRISSGC